MVINMYIHKLKELRKYFGFTQAEISTILKVDQTTYSRWEQGSQTISVEALITLSKFYDVSSDYILDINKHVN